MTDLRREPVTTRLLDGDDLQQVVVALARAFYPDPVFGMFARGPLHEHHQLADVFLAFARDAAPFRQIYLAEAGDRVVGAAVWLPPEGMPRSTQREMMLNVRAARVLAAGRNRVTGFRLLDAIDKVHPKEPHWYLFLLGTDPLMQGRGIGGQLMRPVLESCDRDGLPAYLETQKESNLAFYERYGFAVERKLEVRGAPPVWTMRREPTTP